MVRENSSICFCRSIEDNVSECKCVAPLVTSQTHHSIHYFHLHNTSFTYNYYHYINVFNIPHYTYIIKDINITDIQLLTTYTYYYHYYYTVNYQAVMNSDITILINAIVLLFILIYIMRLTVDYIVSNL